MKKQTLLVDGDHVLYQATTAVETEVRWDADNHMLFSNAEEAYDVFKAILTKKVDAVGGGDIRIAFTGTQNFRNVVYPAYKAGRPRKPLCYWRLLELIFQDYECSRVDCLEADDVLGIWATAGKLTNPIILSEDKDLKTIPGRLYRGGKVIFSTLEEADQFHLFQTLTGDVTDGYPGCPGIGEKRAEAYLVDGWKGVVAAYTKAGLTEDDALVQARCARILRASDWDAHKKEPILWTPAT